VASYYVWSGATGTGSGNSWANAFTTLTLAFATEAAGDTLYVAHDHAETSASTLTLTSSGLLGNPTKVVCVNRAGSVPPVSADRRATAQVTTTGATSITINGTTHYDGLIFSAGTGATATNLFIALAANTIWQRYDNCSFRFAGTGASGLQIGPTAAGTSYIELNNTTFSFAAVSQTIQLVGLVHWRNTPSAILGTIPNVLILPPTARGGSAELIGVDLSAMGSGKTIVDTNTAQGSSYRFIDCKLNSAVTKATVPGAPGSPEIDFIRSGSAGVNYTIYRTRYSGVLTEETTIVRTGGASDGTTPIAWKIVTTANCTYSLPFECPPIVSWNDVTGSARTATIEGVWGGGAVPFDDDIWVEVEYLGDASSPQGSFVSDGKADLLATAAAQTSSSETWGGSTTKFKLGVTFTAQQKGWVYAYVKCAKASSTFYIDPMVTLS
jgi:hypothetical protein